MIPLIQKFWSYVVFLVPSIICSLFVLYHLLFDRALRRSLNNHVIILVLIIGFICQVTIYPWMFYFYNYQGIWYRSSIFCTIWSFIDWSFYIIHIQLFAWCTIERHILIFHDQWVSTRKKRIFVHYLPPIMILFYCLIFYVIVYFVPFCDNVFISSYMLCMQSCVRNIYAVVMWEAIVHQILPVVSVIVFSIALVVRVLWQKHRVRQPIQWRKHRKMTIQVLSISFLYLIFFFPLTWIFLMNWYGVSHDISNNFAQYAAFLSYYVVLLVPFSCLISLPELQTKLLEILHLQRHVRRIVPDSLAMRIIETNRPIIQ